MYGHPSHLNASPSAQLPHEPTLPCTVKSTSFKSLALSFARFASASARLALSSASIRCARPHVQSLQARRRLVLGLQASARGTSACAKDLYYPGGYLRMFKGFLRSSSVSNESGSILSALSSSSLLGISISSSSS